MLRTAPLLAVLVLAGCGDTITPRAAAPTAAPPPGITEDRPPPKVELMAGMRALALERRLRLEAEIARARRSPTVEGALRYARLTRRISPSAETRSRRDWAAAQTMVGKLAGVRRSELAYVVESVRALAAARALTVDRLDPTFLILRNNLRFWPAAPLPASGWRTSFGSDPAIFQYYPGRGLQLQPLASWGSVNALAGACLAAMRSASTKDHCRADMLTLGLDRLTALGARRSGYLAWEYYFAYGSGAPPWVSGMAQATAIQALARGYRALGKARWRRSALAALGAFEQPPPSGVSVPAPGGRHYLLYSFAPDQRVLNGGLQAVIGLRDAAALTHSARAQRLFRSGERAARREVAAYDTGAWSLYSERGAESTFGYHALLAGFLDGLCQRVKARVYCRTGARFRRYEHEPTRIRVGSLRRVRADRTRTVRFTLSKVSSVKVRLWGTRGMSLSRDLQLPRGRHTLSWRPPGRGRFRLRIEAQGPSGPAGVETRTIRITLPKPKKAEKPKKKGKAAPRSAKGSP